MPNWAMPTAMLPMMASEVVFSSRIRPRDERLGVPTLDEDERGHGQGRGHQERGGLDRGPGVAAAGEGHPDEGKAGRNRDEDGTPPVDVHLAPHVLEVEELLEHAETDEGDGHCRPEAPAPADAVHEQTTEKRARDGGDGHDRRHVAGVATALTRRDDRAHDGLGERHEAADADALEPTRDEELRHVLGEAGRERAEQEDHAGDLDEHLLVEEVGQLGPDGAGDRHGQQGHRDDPRVGGLAALQVADDRRQGGAHDGGADQGHEEHGEEAGEDLEDLLVAEVGFLERGLSHGCPRCLRWWCLRCLWCHCPCSLGKSWRRLEGAVRGRRAPG